MIVPVQGALRVPVQAAQGWAVIQEGRILVHTVSSKPRAAMVNWLVIDCRILVMDEASTAQIEREFQRRARKVEVRVARVAIAEAE